MKGAVLFPPRIILGFFNARKDILMTEKTEITNQDLTTKLSEDDFQLVEAGDYVSDAQDAESVEVEEKNTQSETEGEDGKKPVKKSSGKKKGVPTRKLCGMAVLTALAVVLSCTVHIPYFGAAFLEYSPSDVPVLIASFMYGPVWGLVITALVSLIQGLTVSAGSGWFGIAMNFLSTGIFVLSAGLIYKF